MIKHIHKPKNNILKNTLIVTFSDKGTPTFLDLKYDSFHFYEPQINPWFFYHLNYYVKELSKDSLHNSYDNILLLGGSKSGSTSIVLGHILKKLNIYHNIFAWVASPILNITWGKTISSKKEPYISVLWDKIKNHAKIKDCVNEYGNVYKFIDGSFPIMYSYSYDTDWNFDKETFEKISNKKFLLVDHIPISDELRFHNKKRNKIQNIHNIFGYYWHAKRDLFYEKMSQFIDLNI